MHVVSYFARLWRRTGYEETNRNETKPFLFNKAAGQLVIWMLISSKGSSLTLLSKSEVLTHVLMM